MFRHRLVFLVCLGLAGIGLVVLLIGQPPRAARAATLCVQPGNGGCYSSISAALAAAQNGDTIRVVAGTYIEYVTITKTVTLQGGWNAAFTARDPAVNVTTIRPPDSNFSVVHIQGPASPTLDGFTITGGGGGNHGGGLRVTSSNAVVSNNVITGNIGYLLGGGVWVQNGAPRFENNRIENNASDGMGQQAQGGGIQLEGTQAALVNNIIAGNVVSATGYGYGGGVDISGGGPVTLTNNTILSNTIAVADAGTGYGGGLSIQSVPATLSGNVIANNVIRSINGSTGYGGGVDISGNGPVTLTNNSILSNRAQLPGDFGYSYGGGISIRGVTQMVTLRNNIVQDNTANASAASAGYGGGLFIANTPAFILIGNTFSNNAAHSRQVGYGGGAYIAGSAGTATGNVFSNNFTTRTILFNYGGYGYGGGLWVGASTLMMQGGQIADNQVQVDFGWPGPGGGLYADGSRITLDAVRVQNNQAATDASGLMFVNGPYTLTNVVVSGNTGPSSIVGILAQNSPGLLVNNTIAANTGDGIHTASPLTLTNNVIMSHTVGVSLTAPVPVSATFNDFYANVTHTLGFPLGFTDIVIHPQLDASYHLLPTSPAIDAGTHTNAPFTDFDGEPRPMIGTSGLFKVDIGADELTGAAQVNRDLTAQPADFTLIGPGNPQDNPNSDGSNDWIGYAVFGGDVNGDNRADLIAGAPNLSGDFSGGTNDDGRVFALYNTGARRLGVVDLFTDTANLEVDSWLHQQHIGQSFAANDLDGDGQRDLIIGAVGASNFDVTGTVFVFAGGAGLSGTRTLSPTMQANYRIRSDQNTDTFGGANALAAGQLNGAGPDDLAVGEANATVAGRANAGAVYVFFGSSLPVLWDMRVLSASLTIYGPTTNANLGKVVVGDVNGDSQPDLIARSTSTLYVFYGPLATGVIDLATTPASLTLSGLSDGRLAAGDVDGDGKADIIVGDGNRVKVIRGSTFTLQATFTNVTASALYTLDWNGDGKAEIVIGEHPQKRVFVILGSAALSGTADAVDRANWIVTGESAGDQFGFSLGGGDLDADGTPDLIIGSRTRVVDNHSNNFNDAGAVYVLYFPFQRVYLPLVLRN